MNQSKHGVFIAGAYGMGNAGDEQTLRSLVEAFRDYDRGLPLRVLSRRPGETARRYGVEAIHPLDGFGLWRALGRSEFFVHGGGSLLQDVTSQRSLWYYLALTALAKKRGCKVMLYGCGAGPVLREKNRKRCARVLNRCAELITVRDEQSARTLRDWGVERPIRVTADPAFRLSAVAGEREKSIGFALRDWEGFWYRVPYFAAAARYAWVRYGLTPVFISLATEDVRAAKSVMAALGDIPCRLVSGPGEAGRMTAVLSMRLHGLIFALTGGASPVGVSYDPKVTAFCEENGLPWVPLEAAGDENLCALVDRAMEADAEHLAQRLACMRRKEGQNAALARELLNRE